jgi:hypothetical protein
MAAFDKFGMRIGVSRDTAAGIVSHLALSSIGCGPHGRHRHLRAGEFPLSMRQRRPRERLRMTRGGMICYIFSVLNFHQLSPASFGLRTKFQGNPS